MTKQRIKPVQGRKQVKKSENQPVVEKEPVNQAEPTILPNVGRKAKLEAELASRWVKLAEFVADVESANIPLSDYEKLLGMAFDCRNSARKLEKIENPVIIA